MLMFPIYGDNNDADDFVDEDEDDDIDPVDVGAADDDCGGDEQ